MIFNKGIVFLTIPLYTRIMSPSDYGIINVYISYVNLSIPLVGIALPLAIRNSFKEKEDITKDFLCSINILVLVIFLLEFLLLMICSYMFKLNFYDFLWLALIESCFRGIFNNYNMYLMMKVEYKLRTWLSIVLGMSNTLLSILLMLSFFYENKYLGRMYGSCLVSVIIGIYIVIKNRRRLKLKYWLPSLKLCGPLVFHDFSLIIIALSDRLIIDYFIGSEETGKYSLIYNLSMVLLALSAALEGIWIPEFNKKMRENKIDELEVLIRKITHLITFFIILVMLLSPEVLKIMAPKEYWDSYLIIPPILISYFFIYMGTLYLNIEYFFLKTKNIAKITLSTALLNIILNILLVPKFGGSGAALGTLISYFYNLVLHKKLAYKIESKLFPIKNFVVPFILILFSAGVFIFLYNLLIMRYLCLLGFISIIFLINKKELFELFKK